MLKNRNMDNSINEKIPEVSVKNSFLSHGVMPLKSDANHFHKKRKEILAALAC